MTVTAAQCYNSVKDGVHNDHLKENKMKKGIISNSIIALLAAAVIGCCGYAVYNYLSVDTGMIGKKADMTDPNSGFSKNVNVMLTRPEHWHQIAAQKLLTHEEFAGIDGSTATIPITAELARQFYDPADSEISEWVSHNMTDVAYDKLIKGESNSLYHYVEEDGLSVLKELSTQRVRLVFATPPSEAEYAQAKEAGVTLEVEPIALDGFVFITHKDNPVDSLTVQQIKDIYTGRITNWKELGGNDEKIRAFQRTPNSGSQTAMEELVMQGEPMKEAPKAFVSEGMGELVESVAEYENESAAIGYTYYYYINNLYKSPDIKVIKIDGISPDNENLVSGDYPFTAAYYAVIRSDEPEDSVYRKLRDYMLTDEGQEIIRLAGYCPIKG